MKDKIVGEGIPSTNFFLAAAAFAYVDLIKLVLVRHGFTQDVPGSVGV